MCAENFEFKSDAKFSAHSLGPKRSQTNTGTKQALTNKVTRASDLEAVRLRVIEAKDDPSAPRYARRRHS